MADNVENFFKEYDRMKDAVDSATRHLADALEALAIIGVIKHEIRTIHTSPGSLVEKAKIWLSKNGKKK